MSGEMMTALFAAFAQAESQSISTNMRLGNRMRMKTGTFLPSSVAYGYRLHNRTFEIEPFEAQVVRKIFKDYLAGINMTMIAESLNHAGITRLKNNLEIMWRKTSIRYILSNERYIGDSLWQKTYATDTFPPVMRRNYGEMEMYYVHETHPAIISKEEFNAVQLLIQRRAEREIRPQDNSPFSGKIFCGQCRTSFRRKDSHDKRFWSCRKHDQNLSACSAQQISDSEVKNAFLRLYYKLKHHGETIFGSMLTNLQTIRSRRMLWSVDIVELNKEISDLLCQNQMLTELKKQGLIDPDIFIAQSNELADQLRTAKLKKERLLDADGDNTIAQTQELMEILDAGPDFLDTFDTELFRELVEKIIVESNERVRFHLKNGLELIESVERTIR
jgi:hypothetical protein